jgi:hypothetical protein
MRSARAPRVALLASRAQNLERMSAPRARRERWIAPLAILVLAAIPFRSALLRTDRVLLGVDTGSAVLPWSAALGGAVAPANPDLADQAMQFYPWYRWVARSWLSGDPPLWNPKIYAGSPGLANLQAGVLDPQVLALALLERAGGERLFHAGFAWLAWLRVAAAALGAWCLARRLGLGRAGSALAATAFGLSGYLCLWLNHALGHVPPFLPWVLWFLEGIRGPRPLRAAAGAGFALLGALLGGHAETAFYVGAAAGLWALALLAHDRRAGLLALAALAFGTAAAGAALLPFVEYLDLSAAKWVREAQASALRAAPDLAALGCVALVAGLVFLFRRAAAAGDAGERALRGRELAAAVLGLALAGAGAALFLARRGLSLQGALALVPDLYGKPGSAPFRGPGTYLESASAWIAFPALAFALAGILGPSRRLPRRALVAALGVLAFLLAIELPGLLDLYRFVPTVGLGATVRFAPVAALFLGLLAGEALEQAGRAPRWAAAALLALGSAAVLAPAPLRAALGLGGVVPLDPSLVLEPDENELVGFTLVPPATIDGVDSPFEGWLDAAVPLERAVLAIEAVDPSGAVLAPSARERVTVPLAFYPGPSARSRAEAPAKVAAAHAGARWFATPYVHTKRLAEGHWRFTVELYSGAEESPAARRLVGVSTVERRARPSGATLAFLVLGLAALVVGGASALVRGGVVLLAILQGLWFAEGLNPAVPRERVFPATRTEEILARELGAHRFLGDPGVLPPNTGLVRDLASIEGYDAMDVLAFNAYRNYVFPAGGNTLLAWNARGVDYKNQAFRLLGVKLVALAAPSDDPALELVASPEEEEPARRAETWIYRVRDPLPRAFLVPRVISLDELAALHAADPRGWNPLGVAGLDDDWRPAAPFARGSVGEPALSNREVRLSAELDGDGLLVLTDQAYPGWKVYVDGTERSCLVADMIWRAVALGPGKHEVVFRYEPHSLALGLWISLLGLAGLAVLLVFGSARKASRG